MIGHGAGPQARTAVTSGAPVEVVLRVRNLGLVYPSGAENSPANAEAPEKGLAALQGVTFDLHAQEFACLLGPSGSGKSSLLRVLAGLLKPTSGEVAYPSKQQPRVGLVFQEANLMPWRTVIQNIMLPLTLQGISEQEAHARAQDWVNLVGLKGFEDAWPRDLSGGMAQRVAIARSLIQDPDLLLLDEPFGALDALTRERMGAELLNLWQGQRKTVLMITHSIGEALLLSDRVLVFSLRPGRIELDLPVTLPRPRQDEMRYSPEFGEMARKLKSAIQQNID